MCHPRLVSSSRRRPTGLTERPSPRAPFLYRVCVLLARFIARWIFGLRMELRGAEHLPRDAAGRRVGGWIAAPIAHRSWIDPFLLVILLPVEPHLYFFADGRVLFYTWFRRLLFRLVGGIVPVWPRGGRGAFFEHMQAAGKVIDAGAVFVIYPEAQTALPPPGEARKVEAGIGYLALRTSAPVVPMLLGGTSELYRGRRLTLEVLPARPLTELAGLPPDRLPAPDTPDERVVARQIAGSFEEPMLPRVAARYQQDLRESVGDRKRWTWLTHWLDLEWEGDRARKVRP